MRSVLTHPWFLRLSRCKSLLARVLTDPDPNLTRDPHHPARPLAQTKTEVNPLAASLVPARPPFPSSCPAEAWTETRSTSSVASLGRQTTHCLLAELTPQASHPDTN
ncbi:hypothetical protein RRG08_061018 [Elysia crispata]|uniref:Uncharacterized protein n=1 Tax=Elysia crispata TaxID=231223 RepID=A0AAE1AUV7_9GAST|nr:hypothetical protein RRG08_061018 [Elysia crispata]